MGGGWWWFGFLLIRTVFVGSANAQDAPPVAVYSDDAGNLKIDLAANKKLTADSAYGGKPSAVDILAKINNLKSRLAALKMKGTDKTEVENALLQRTVSDEWTGSDGRFIKLGLFHKSQAVNIDVSHVGCGIHSGFSYTVASRLENTLSLEAFQKGHAQNVYQTDKFSVVAGQYQKESWLYWLWVKVESTCENTDSKDDHRHKTVVRAQVGTVDISLSGLIERPDETQAKTPPSNAFTVNELSLEKTFESSSNVRGNYLEFTVPVESSEVPQYNFAGEVIKTNPVKVFKKTLVPLGLASASTVLKVEVDLGGCGPRIGLSFTVVGSTGTEDDAYDRRLTAYTMGIGGKPLPKWANGGSVAEADIVSLKFEPNPLNEKNQFYLWLQIDGSISGSMNCVTPELKGVVKVAAGSGLPMQEIDVSRDPPRKLGDISTISFEEVAIKVDNLQPDPLVMSWTETTGIVSTPEPLYLGLYTLRQSVMIKVEQNLYCGVKNAYNFHLSPSLDGVFDFEAKRMSTHIRAYEFGSALDQIYMQDKIGFKYQKVGGNAHIWMTYKPKEGSCEKAEEKTNTITVYPIIYSDRVTNPDGDGPVAVPKSTSTDESPVVDIDIVSLQDTIGNLANKEDLRSAAALAVGQRMYREDWEGTVALVQEPEEAKQFTKYIGTFSVEEVVHIDATDTGCNSNVGIYANVVSRWAGTPESFIMGSASADAVRDAIQLYWRASPNPKDAAGGSAKYYDLYVGVTEKQCAIPFQFREDKAAATKWWKEESWMKGAQPKHVLAVTVRRSGKTPGAERKDGTFRCADDDAYLQTQEGPWTCGRPQELRLKFDGSVQSPGEFSQMTRISAEDIAQSTMSMPAKYGDIRDWDSVAKAPIWGPNALTNTILPYEFTVSELVSLHDVTRNFHYQYIEKIDGIDDPNGLMYTPNKCANCDKQTGYMYLGKFHAEQVVEIDFADIAPWAFGGSIRCTGKPWWGKATTQSVVWRRPECFTYGTAAFRPDTMTIVYKRLDQGGSQRLIEYWLASGIKPTSLREGTVWRRDYQIKTRAVVVAAYKSMGLTLDTLRFGKFAKTDQGVMLADLNDALDPDVTDKDQGTINFVSMEDADIWNGGSAAFPIPGRD